VGLRPQHYAAFEGGGLAVDFLEIILENYVGRASLPRQRLETIASRYPIVGHGVGLNLLGADPIDLEHLAAIKRLVDAFRLPYVSDHLCWCATGNIHHHDLLPAPFDDELIPYAADRAAFVQDYLGVPFGIENLSSYLTWERDAMPEWEFYREVVERAGCSYMLDINNVYVSSVNHGFDPHAYLRAIDWSRVLQVHIAGHDTLATGMRQDTHDRVVDEDVWSLYRAAWQHGGPFPSLLEWDDKIPSAEILVAEVNRARSFQT